MTDLDLRQVLVEEHGFYWQLWEKDKHIQKLDRFLPARWWSSSRFTMAHIEPGQRWFKVLALKSMTGHKAPVDPHLIFWNLDSNIYPLVNMVN